MTDKRYEMMTECEKEDMQFYFSAACDSYDDDSMCPCRKAGKTG